MATINVLDADGNVVALEKPLTPGRTAAASSRPVALSTEDLAAITALATALALFTKAEDAAHGSGDSGIMALGVRKDTAAATAGADGDYQPPIFDASGKLWVNAGTVTASNAGDVAHDAADSGNPVKVGGQARTTNPTAVADGDRTNFIADKTGKQIVVQSIRDLKGVQKTTITSSTSETTIVTAAGASVFADLYGLIIANTSATACNVTIKDATSGTTRAIIAVPAGDTRGFMVSESGAVPQATANNNWTATCSASVSSIEITAMYVKNL